MIIAARLLTNLMFVLLLLNVTSNNISALQWWGIGQFLIFLPADVHICQEQLRIFCMPILSFPTLVLDAHVLNLFTIEGTPAYC